MGDTSRGRRSTETVIWILRVGLFARPITVTEAVTAVRHREPSVSRRGELDLVASPMCTDVSPPLGSSALPASRLAMHRKAG